MSSQQRMSEKINDLFLVTMSEFETNLVSSVIKLNSQPQKLIEDVQLSINEFKQKMYSSLIQIIQLIANYGNPQNKDVRQIADDLQQQIVKYKQTNLLLQMKSMVNSKLKALLETLNFSQASMNKKQEVIQLTDSLQKIEQTITQSHSTSPQPQPSYITPLARRQQQSSYSQSQEGLTPNLSEEAERKVKVQFITPKQQEDILHQNAHEHNERSNTHFQFTPISQVQHHFSLENSILLNKSLNSFTNENHELKEKDREHKEFNSTSPKSQMEQLISNAYKSDQSQKPLPENQLPQFGGQETQQVLLQKMENEFMVEGLESFPVKELRQYVDNFETEEDLTTVPTPVIGNQKYYLTESPRNLGEIVPYQKIFQRNIHSKTERPPIISRNLKQLSSSLKRKNSTQSLSQITGSITNQSPSSGKIGRTINSTNSKQQFKRSTEKIQSVNLLTRLNQADSKKDGKQNKENNSNCANSIKSERKLPQSKGKAPQLVKQKSTGIIKPARKVK